MSASSSTNAASSSASSRAGEARGSGSAPLTIFAVPKVFRGHIAVIQRNAIASWTRINPRPDVILFGTDEGTAEVASELGVQPWATIAHRGTEKSVEHAASQRPVCASAANQPQPVALLCKCRHHLIRRLHRSGGACRRLEQAIPDGRPPHRLGHYRTAGS
jgi:hypothetical protein